MSDKVHIITNNTLEKPEKRKNEVNTISNIPITFTIFFIVILNAIRITNIFADFFIFTIYDM